VRAELTRERLHALMRAIAESAPPKGSWRVYLVGGGTAVAAGWRASSVDADLWSDREEVFRDIQEIKERVGVNVELVRPEHFVPALRGSAERHVPVETIGDVSFFHYDPYAQVFAKIVRGFRRDVEDARRFLESGLVDPQRLRALVQEIPDAAWAGYPALSAVEVRGALDDFLQL